LSAIVDIQDAPVDMESAAFYWKWKALWISLNCW
jgi:hypothetical protein